MTILADSQRFWHRLSGSDRYAECVRVLLALGGIVGWYLIRGQFAAAIPVLLGAIACALAETEDHWRNRLATLLMTLACFAIAAFAVQWLFVTPWLFALSLPLATFVLVMLGAASGRYATIAGATLLLSVYTMIGADLPQHGPTDLLAAPLKLLAGAGWYGLLSLLWSAVSPQRAVRHALARLFDTLADYLDAKAALFEPVRGLDRDALQLALAMRNEKVVQALNETRLVLIDRIGARSPRGNTAALLQLYFTAQDIHERVSSSHYSYAALGEAFFHSDVLFRCEHLLHRQAHSCRRRADSLRLRTPCISDPCDRAALEDVRASIQALRLLANPAPETLLRPLEALLRNVGEIHVQLNESTTAVPADTRGETETALQDPEPQTLREAWARIRIQLTPRSFRFRHAVRLALALLAGYGVLLLVHPRNGYWILLTTLLVCQPTYRATRRLLMRRVLGTVLGLVAGWAALHLLTVPWQLLLVVLSGVFFFAARRRRYLLATASITLFVVLCFNQIGNGYEMMGPRLLDTLIGAGIAALAIRLVLPDWQGRQFNQVLADTVHYDARYLARILPQYASGKHDDLAYRIARRDAHNADATLSGVLANMLREPGHQRQGSETLLRFLTASHGLLGHLSALGVHRQVIASADALAGLERAGEATVAALETLAARLHGDATKLTATPILPAQQTIDDPAARLAIGQLALVLEQHARLVALAAEIPHG